MNRSQRNYSFIKRWRSRRVNYAALNSGRIENNDQNDRANIDSLKDQLKIEEENLQTWRNNLHQYQNERNNIISDLCPVSTL